MPGRKGVFLCPGKRLGFGRKTPQKRPEGRRGIYLCININRETKTRTPLPKPFPMAGSRGNKTKFDRITPMNEVKTGFFPQKTIDYSMVKAICPQKPAMFAPTTVTCLRATGRCRQTSASGAPATGNCIRSANGCPHATVSCTYATVPCIQEFPYLGLGGGVVRIRFCNSATPSVVRSRLLWWLLSCLR